MSRSINRSFQKSFAPKRFLDIHGRQAVFVIALLWLQMLSGCGRKPEAPGAPPPPPVTVAHPVQHEVMEWDTFNGYLEATQSANVSARVSGLIVEAPFTEGSLVKKSQVLFVLDDRPFKADLAAKLAEQEKAGADVAITLLNYRRLEGIIKQSGVSQQEFETAKADHEKAKATLAGAKAAVDNARLNLEWCKVIAPIDGRVSSKMKTVGNLVNGGSGPATLLTTIQSVNPIYCNFDVDERSIQKYQKLATEKKRMHERDGQVPCYVQLTNETGFPHVGFVDFLDNRVDRATGTVQERALLQNPDGMLTPGFYATVCIPGSARYKALLVPDKAIGNDQNHRTVLVINKDNIVDVRKVELGALFGEFRSITSGLTPDDLVIINGQMKAFPGTPVAPTETALTVDSASLGEPVTAKPGAAASVPGDPPAGTKKTGGAP